MHFAEGRQGRVGAGQEVVRRAEASGCGRSVTDAVEALPAQVHGPRTGLEGLRTAFQTAMEGVPQQASAVAAVDGDELPAGLLPLLCLCAFVDL